MARIYGLLMMVLLPLLGVCLGGCSTLQDYALQLALQNSQVQAAINNGLAAILSGLGVQ